MSDIMEPSLSISEIANQIQNESDISKSKELIDLFNWSLSKKHITRVAKLDDLFDDITDQMVARFKHKPDQFSNDDLLNYMKTVQAAIDNNSKHIEDMPEAPKIVQNNTQINVNLVDKFDRESRARILAAVQATLAAASSSSEPLEYEDKTEGDISNEL